MVIVVSGFGALGAFIYYLLYKNIKQNVYLYSKTNKNIKFYKVNFLDKGKNIFVDSVDDVKFWEDKGKIDYLFLASKTNNVIDYLRIFESKFDRLVLVQNGIGLEEEVKQFAKKIYYLTFTTSLSFDSDSNELFVYNSKKSEVVLSRVSGEKVDDFELNLSHRYCFFRRYYGNHWDVRFSKLLLNLILNVVPTCFEKLPWDLSKEEEFLMEKKLISEIFSFFRIFNLRFFNFKSYNTYFIGSFYKYCPFFLFRLIFSFRWLVLNLRDFRIPSFYQDLLLKRKKTEVEYYLGWYKKRELLEKIALDSNAKNFDLGKLNFESIEWVYNRISELEKKYII